MTLGWEGVKVIHCWTDAKNRHRLVDFLTSKMGISFGEIWISRESWKLKTVETPFSAIWFDASLSRIFLRDATTGVSALRYIFPLLIESAMIEGGGEGRIFYKMSSSYRRYF